MAKNDYHYLKDKWTKKHSNLQTTLWDKHKDSLSWISKNLSPKQLAVSSLGLLLLAAPSAPLLPSPHLLTTNQNAVQNLDKSVFVVSDLSKVLPLEMRPLTEEEEQKVGEILSRDFNMKVSAQLLGKRLNRSYGFIGQEQHLARFPGDTLSSHFDNAEEAEKYGSHGMAPGLGAWGYIGDNMREKYYIAVQTFLTPGYMENVREYNQFFKYRKMLVVNPDNGHAVVAVIGDAGPAGWTGKHLGGSPEVMRHLERVDGKMRGEVLYFFIDDPDDKIQLGPVDTQ